MTMQPVQLARVVNAPIARVFDAWLDPETLAVFMKPAPGTEVHDVTVDARVGGAFGLTMVIGETRVPIHGVYTRLERPDDSGVGRLSFTWVSIRTVGAESEVALTFEALDGARTRLTLEHIGFPDPSSRDDHEGGWTRILATLGARLDPAD
jgi:uncharacterized protein YndB with AHSA1/START domain